MTAHLDDARVSLHEFEEGLDPPHIAKRLALCLLLFNLKHGGAHILQGGRVEVSRIFTGNRGFELLKCFPDVCCHCHKIDT